MIAGAVLMLACAQPDVTPAPAAVPVTKAPEIRIGLLVNVRHATIGGGGAFRVSDPDEGELSAYLPGTQLDAGALHGDVVLTGDVRPVERAVFLIEAVDTDAVMRVNGHDYQGSIELRASDSGLVVINHVTLEDYLIGVVGAELGRRAPGDEEALKAQAVVSRTYALRNQGRYKNRGFDLMSSVNDQVYAGQLSDNAMAATAVRATRGEIVAVNGQPIDAFFSSTCGGRTEDGSAAFAGASRPYLQSVDDLDPSGIPWCAISPRFRWTATWSGAELSNTLRRTLAAEHLPGGAATGLSAVQIGSRTATGRVAAITLVGRGGRTVVSGQAIRRVLSPLEGGLLRSTDFTVRLTRSGSRLERVDIEGRGNGHGVGMCQWGAIGRSRAGQDYRTILASYFPGTDIQQAY